MRIAAVRVARQTDRLADVVAFYRDVVGLPVIGGFEDHDGYDGVMLGMPGEAVHLEFTAHAAGSPGQPGGADDLLVMYVDTDTIEQVAGRAEGRRITGRGCREPVLVGGGCGAVPGPGREAAGARARSAHGVEPIRDKPDMRS